MEVALKTIQRFSAAALMRFKQEFRALQDIEHPNLVRLGELFEAAREFFFTMELVRGSNLFDHIWCHAAEGAAGPDPVSPWDPTRTSGFDAGVVDESREASVGHAVRRGAGEPPIWGGCARHSGSWSAASTRSIGRASSIATSSHPTRWSMPRAGWCCSI